jgi:hypothetical protein
MIVGPFAYGSRHPETLVAIELASAYVRATEACELGQFTSYSVGGGGLVSGTLDDLTAKLREPDQGFSFATDRGFRFSISCGVGGRPEWSATSFDSKVDGWLPGLGRLATTLSAGPLPWLSIGLARQDKRLDFVPSPPIARHKHIVTTDDAEVAASYTDPELFWRQWKVVHASEQRRLCIRALDAYELPNYLARTFAGTMDLARNAKPGQTQFGTVNKWEPALRAFWEPGPFAEEKAGLPALEPVGYDPATKTLKYSGFIEKTGDEHVHVLAKEIVDLYTILDANADDEGRPVEHIEVLFLDEWMARQERRPLRDVGARVFYMGKNGKQVELTD